MTTPTPTTPGLDPVRFDAPLVNPSPNGLYGVTTWDETTLPRWLASGVEVRPHNYGGEDAFGVWAAEWCGDPGDEIKDGTRPEPDDPFLPITVWAYAQCDLTAPSKVETRARAQQNLRLLEQNAVEREFSARLLADVGTPEAAADIIAAVGYLEGELAKAGVIGLIHASADLAAYAARFNLITRAGGVLKTPLGHTWVFGGGYVEGLGDTLVATSPTFGWRDTVSLREADEVRYNQFVAVAERSAVVGYEKAVAAATID